MGLFRPSREHRGPDPYLDWKIGLFLAGAAMGIAGMALDRAWIIACAIALLAIGALLRFLPRPEGDAGGDSPG
jgi:hypothetical protein